MPDTAAASDTPTSHRPASPQARWPVIAALVVAVAALALAGWALVRPAAPAAATDPAEETPAAAEQDPAQAKAALCPAVDIVRNAVSIQTNTDPGADPAARQAVAANARLATLGGGQYLLSRLAPDTPAELAEAVRTFANTLQDIGMKQLSGLSNTDPALAAQLNDAQTASNRLTELCK